MIFPFLYLNFTDNITEGNPIVRIAVLLFILPFLFSLLYILYTKFFSLINSRFDLPKVFDRFSFDLSWLNRSTSVSYRVRFAFESFVFSKYEILGTKIGRFLSKIEIGKRLRNNPYTRGFFQYEPPESVEIPSTWELVKSPLIIVMIGSVVVVFFPLMGVGQAPEIVFSGFTALSSGYLYSNLVNGYTPADFEVPNWITRIFIPTYLLIPQYLHPNIQLAQLSLYPLLFVIILYILNKTGIWYGFGIIILGYILFLTTGAFIKLGEYLSGEGYLQGTFNLLVLSAVFSIIFLSLVLMLYGIYRLKGEFDPWFHYPFLGAIIIMATEALYFLGQVAYSIGYSYDLVYLYFQLVRPFRILGALIMVYGIYRLFKKAEQLAGVSTR